MFSTIQLEKHFSYDLFYIISNYIFKSSKCKIKIEKFVKQKPNNIFWIFKILYIYYSLLFILYINSQY